MPETPTPKHVAVRVPVGDRPTPDSATALRTPLPQLGACGCGSGCGCGCQSGAPCQCGGCTG
ncbi:hypothetical protein [Actinacidiphila paucisporea]|uniref:Metallothionein n=1 Tax=Actinacidiphila paucisporea TaxID=310782 RepID=A0A1M7PBN3_9ACTN|nr:hypothetical protein SAMN05216499_12288 [Actinacidiphila paucisporea]